MYHANVQSVYVCVYVRVKVCIYMYIHKQIYMIRRGKRSPLHENGDYAPERVEILGINLPPSSKNDSLDNRPFNTNMCVVVV